MLVCGLLPSVAMPGGVVASQVEAFEDGLVPVGSDYLSKPSLASDQENAEAQTVERSAGVHLLFSPVLVEHA